MTMYRKMQQRQGAVTVLVLLGMVAMCGMAALTIDLAQVQLARQQLQTAADAAALAGASRLRAGADPVGARLAAQSVAETNMVLGDGATLNAMLDVTVGDYDQATGRVSNTISPERLPVVKVTARRTGDSPDGPVPTHFARLFGVQALNVQATAIASVGSVGPGSPRQPIEVIIVQDASYSFREEMNDAKQADRSLVDLISDAGVAGDRVALVNFAGQAWRVADFGNLPASAASIKNKISSSDYCKTQSQMLLNRAKYYGTHTGAGIDEAVAIFKAQGTAAAEKVIVLVSDGMPYPPERRALAVAAADRAAALGIRIHTVTFDREGGGDYGIAGADAEFNASLIRNGGYCFHTPQKKQLEPILKEVGSIEIGRPRLIY